MNLTTEIETLIKKAEAMKPAVGVNKKYLNKCIDRLTDASLYSEKIIMEGSLAAQPQAFHGVMAEQACICLEGAIDADCPMHGRR